VAVNTRLYARKPELQGLMTIFHVIDLTDTIGGRSTSRPNMPKPIRSNTDLKVTY